MSQVTMDRFSTRTKKSRKGQHQQRKPKVRPSLQDVPFMVKPIDYPASLPAELQAAHVYLLDNGHCIMCLLKQHEDMWGKTNNRYAYEVPVPVKYMLQNEYHVYNGFIVVDLPYDDNFGVDVPDGFSEFEEE